MGIMQLVLAGGSSAKAEGGSEFEAGGYKFLVFTAPGVLEVNVEIPGADYLVVGGGGGGAQYNGGGGGAGGVRKSNPAGLTLTVGSHAVTVGDGGDPGTVLVPPPSSPPGYPSGYGDPGDPSSLGSLIDCVGGGAGGGNKNMSTPPYDGAPGGSGGGGGAYPNSILGSGGSGTPSPAPPSGEPQGQACGSGEFYTHPNAGGGGGGGGGAAGGTGRTRTGGDGVPVSCDTASNGTQKTST